MLFPEEDLSYSHDEAVQHEHCFTISNKPHTGKETTATKTHFPAMVHVPYASPPIKPVSQVTLTATKNNYTRTFTFQVVDTEQPALLSTEASKALGVLTLNADYIRQCSTTSTPQSQSANGSTDTSESAVGPPPASPDTSRRVWPKLGTLTMDFITKNCTSLFQGAGYLGPPVDFDLDPSVKPIHAPVHRQPISKLDKIKAALDAHEATGQLIRVSQPRLDF